MSSEGRSGTETEPHWPNWNELRSMIEKSTMAMSLPPYETQCLGNVDSVFVSGIEMFNEIGQVSDGRYYGAQLESILDSGGYTGNLSARTYYPNDDTTNLDTNAVGTRLEKFADSLTPTPGMWVHYGHGSFDLVAVDGLWDENEVSRHINLTTGRILSDAAFATFQRMAHYRMVGCETNTQELQSIARALLSKPHGGALTYVGTAHYSYPVVESRLLTEETRLLADSSLFTWGEVWHRAAENVLGSSAGWDIARWVVLGRSFMGDPLLPVRTQRMTADSTLSIDVAEDSVTSSGGSLTVTVRDADSNNVEGAWVGLLSQRIETEPEASAYEPIRDVAFAGAVTNRKGTAKLYFDVSYEDTVMVTAAHADYPAKRKKVAVGTWGGDAGPAVEFRMVDVEAVDTSLARNGVFEPGDTLRVKVRFTNNTAQGMHNFSVTLTPDTAGTGIVLAADSVISSIDSIGAGEWRMYHKRYYFQRCPSGQARLGWDAQYTYTEQTGGAQTASAHYSVTGPRVLPLIKLLEDTDENYAPDGGDAVTMQLILINGSAASALGVRAKLVSDDGNINITDSLTEPKDVIGTRVSEADTSIHYTVGGGYDEETAGIIQAKLILTGDNMAPDTLETDLNPIRDLSFAIDRDMAFIDYRNAVGLQWDALKVDTMGNIRSDFNGFVVMRRAGIYEIDPAGPDTTWNWDAVSRGTITSSNYFYDDVEPEAEPDSSVYYVYAIDNSYNHCAVDAITKVRTPLLKAGFPIATNNVMQPPVTGDIDKDGIAEMYTVTSADGDKGNVIGYRANGQEAVVEGRNDGLIYGGADAWQTAVADLDGDGYDEVIYATDDSLYARNYKDTTLSWGKPIADGNHSTREGDRLLSVRKPITANVTGDSLLEVIVTGTDWGENGVHTVDIYDHEGTRLARREFPDAKCPAMPLAVGDFKTSASGLEILAGAGRSGTDRNYLYLLGSDLTILDSMFVCNANPDSGSMFLNSAISVGNLYGGPDTLEVVFTKGQNWYQTSGVGDTVMVVPLVVSSGALAKADTAQYPIDLNLFTMFGSAPALGDLDLDGTDDIAYAGDDSLSLLKMSDQSSLSSIATLSFGMERAARLSGQMFTPQALIADIDNDDTNEVVVNHQQDGMIWAFGPSEGGEWEIAERFPLRTEGRVSKACEITDLDADGTLDLVAVDEAGYMYAWNLAQGSPYSQPWPTRYGNSWNTGYSGYKSGGVTGHLYEDWSTARVAPYKWLETGTTNSTTEVSYGAFERDGGVLKSDDGSDRNYHFQGPAMDVASNYTIRGKLKFGDASAEFGINFYSQWPTSSQKYSLLRLSDGKFTVRAYSDASTYTTVATTQDAYADSVGKWYWYKVRVDKPAADNRVSAAFWEENDPDPTLGQGYQWPIRQTDTSAAGGALDSGLVGVVTHSGTGYRYWGPITVTTNNAVDGAYMAHEDFRAESVVVDVEPFVPHNWHPEYAYNRLEDGLEVNGFVMDTVGPSDVLVYRYRPGVGDTAICRLIPETNLEWKNYEFGGTLLKQGIPQQDTAEVGLIAYDNGEDRYLITFKEGGVYLQGGAWTTPQYKNAMTFEAGDSIAFTVRTQGLDLPDGNGDIVKDSVIQIGVEVSKNGQSPVDVINADETEDYSGNRVKGGYPGIWVDISRLEGDRSGMGETKVRRAMVQKVQ